MKLGLFSVRDEKAEVFSPPLSSMNVGTITRSLFDVLKSGSHDYAKHPEDYVLYHLGTFDDQTGQMELFTAPKSVVVLRDLLSSEAK